MERTGAERPHFLDNLIDALDKRGGHRGRKVDHQQPLGADADLIEHRTYAVGAFARAQIAFQEVAAAFQAPGYQDAVDAFLESLQDVLHLDLAGARRMNDAHVGGILHAFGTGQVGRRVGAVVTAEGDDARFPVRCHTLTPATSSSSSMATSASSSWCWRVMVRAGQEAAQLPHPMHLAPCISALFRLLIMGAPYGQTLTHVAQATQSCGLTRATWPGISRKAFDRMVVALPAAACACAMVSSMNRGECAKPHRNSPSLARSTGRSLGWASRKKPSAVSALRSRPERTGLPAAGAMPVESTSRSGRSTRLRFDEPSCTVTFSLPLSSTTTGSLFSG